MLPRRNLEAIGAVGGNLRSFSFGGSVEPLRWSAQPWSSSETQGQIVGTRKSLNGRENMARRKTQVFWLLIGARKLVFFWHQSEARTAATVWN